MADFFDALEKPPTVEQITPAPKPAGDFFDSLENPVQTFAPQFLAGKLRDRTTWAEVEPELKKLGADPEQYRQGYQLDEARAVQQGEGLGYDHPLLPRWVTATAESFKRQSTPFGDVFGVKGEKPYSEALARYQRGEGTQADAMTIARYERLQGVESDMGKTFAGQVVGGLASIPKMVGETEVAGGVLGLASKARYVGAPLRAVGFGAPAAAPLLAAANPTATRAVVNYAGRGAVMLPAIPSMYVPEARQRNLAAGRPADDIRGYPTAVAMGYANLLVLGSLQKFGNTSPSLGRQMAVKGVIGAGEQSLADAAFGAADNFLPDAYKTNTRYGVLGNIARGEGGEALKHATVQALTFSVFAGLHGKQESPGSGKAAAKQVIDSATKLIDTKPADEVARTFEELNKAVVEPGVTKEKLKEQFKDADPAVKEIIDQLPDKIEPPAPPREPLPGERYNPDLDAEFAKPVEKPAPSEPTGGDRLNAELDALFEAPADPQKVAEERFRVEQAFRREPPKVAQEPPVSEPAPTPESPEIVPPGANAEAKPAVGDRFGREKAMGAALEAAGRGEKVTYVDADVDNMAGLTKAVGQEKGLAHLADMIELVRGELAGTGAKVEVFRHAGDPKGDEHSFIVTGADKRAVDAALARAQAKLGEYAKANGLADLSHAKGSRKPGVGLSTFAEPVRKGQKAAEVYAEAEAGTETLKSRRVVEAAPSDPAAVEKAARESPDVWQQSGADRIFALRRGPERNDPAGLVEAVVHYGLPTMPDNPVRHTINKLARDILGAWSPGKRAEAEKLYRDRTGFHRSQKIAPQTLAEVVAETAPSEPTRGRVAEIEAALAGEGMPDRRSPEEKAADAERERKNDEEARKGEQAYRDEQAAIRKEREALKPVRNRIENKAVSRLSRDELKAIADEVGVDGGKSVIATKQELARLITMKRAGLERLSKIAGIELPAPSEPTGQPAPRPGADLPLPVLRELADAAGVKWQGKDAAALLDALEGSKKGKAVLAAELAERGEARPARVPEKVPVEPAGEELPARFGQSFRDQVNDAVNNRVLSAEEGHVVDDILAGKSLRKIELLKPNGKPYSHQTVANRFASALERLGANKELVAEIKRVQALDAVERFAKGEEVSMEELAVNPEEVAARVQEAESEENQKAEAEADQILKEFDDAVAQFKRLGVADPEGRAREVVRRSEEVPADQGAPRPAEAAPAEAGPPSAAEVVNRGVSADAWRAEQRRLREAREAELAAKAKEKAAKEAAERAAVEQRKAERAAAAEAKRQAEAKRKKFNAAERAARGDTFASQVVSYGGIDPTGAEFLAHYGSAKEAIEDGIPARVFKGPDGKRGTLALDTLAQEWAEVGQIARPDPALILDGLREGRTVDFAEVGHRHDKAAEENARLQQEQHVDETITRAAAEAEPGSLAAKGVEAAVGNLGDVRDPRRVAEEFVSRWLEVDKLSKGDPDQTGPLEAVLEAAGAERVGQTGDVVKFDGKLHEVAEGNKPNTGTEVEVERPGWTMRTPDGATLRLVPAQVRRAAPSEPTGEPNDFFTSFLKEEGGYLDLDVLGRVLTRAFGRARGKDPAWAGDPDPNPDNPRALPPDKVVKRAAFNQVGARNVTRPEIATTAHAWAKHQSDQLANAWQLAHKNLDAVFPVDPRTGEVALANGQRGFLEDVIRDELAKPLSQFNKLTPEQRQAVELWRNVWAKQLKAMEREGVKQFRDANGDEIPVADLLKKGYFPRPAVAEPAVVGWFNKLLGRTAGPSSLPGVQPGYRKSRVYATEAEGVKNGVKYNPSFSERVASFIRATNREIADTRLANDKLLGGVDVIEPYFKRLLAQNKDVLKLLPNPERDQLVRRLRGLASAAATGNVFVAPAFKGKEYPPEVKAHLEAMYGQRGGKILGVAGALNQELRNLVLSLDASFATLQLQAMMFSNPVRWARTLAKAPEAFFSPDLLPRLVQSRPEFRQAVDEITQAGGSIGTKPEQLGGGQAGESLIGRLPVFKQAQRMFGTIMDIAKIELWNANRPADPKQWPRAVEALENSLGQGRMEQLGMTPERAFLERFLLLAPGYYRGFAALLPQLGQGGAGGAIARKQLGALTSGVLLTGLAGLYAAKAAGWITQDELEERLNPTRGKFLTVPVPLGSSGKSAEVGLGGFYMSLMRTAGNAVAYQKGEKTDNPYLRWYRGHAGVLPRLGWDVATGRDYGGNPVGAGEAVGKAVAPLPVQQMLMGEDAEQGTTGQRAAATAGGLLGLRAFPTSSKGQHFDQFRAWANEQGKDVNTASIQERGRLLAKFEKTHPAPSEPTTVAAVEKATAADLQRSERLTKAVGADTRRKLADLGKSLPSYDPTMSHEGKKTRLTRPEQARYEALLAEEYDKAISRWDVGRMQNWNKQRRDAYMEEKLKDAKERAKTRLLRESTQQSRLGLGLR